MRSAQLSLQLTFTKLDNVQVFHAPELVTKVALIGRHVGASVRGDALAGPQVVYKDYPDAAKFFVNEQTLTPDARQCFSQKFAAFSSVKHDGMKRLLDYVFMKDDPESPTDELTKAGVSSRADQSYNPDLLQQPILAEAVVTDGVGAAEDSPAMDSSTSPSLGSDTSTGANTTPVTDIGTFEDSALGNATFGLVKSLPIPPSLTAMPAPSVPFAEPIDTTPASKKTRELGKNSRKGKFVPLDLAVASSARDESSLTTNGALAAGRPSLTGGQAQSESVLQMRSGNIRRSGLQTNVSGPSVRTYSKVKSAEQELLELKTGLEGEKLTYNRLQEIFDNSLPISVWTSELRPEAGHPPWVAERNTNYTDFTIKVDTNEADPLGKWLKDEGIALPRRPRNRPRTYHIEVKATASGSVYEPFQLSDSQINMATEFKDDWGHIFLIFRWYAVDPEGKMGGMPGLEIYPNPHVAEEAGILKMSVSQWVLERRTGETSSEEESEDDDEVYDDYGY